MRLRCFAVVCAVIACAALYALLSYPSTPSSALGERPVKEAVSSIDFDTLHAQANGALEALQQQSRKPRVASAAASQ